jgi:peptidoglycan/xylan/chitin deacetylase (PgdA/CDA1 family)
MFRSKMTATACWTREGAVEFVRMLRNRLPLLNRRIPVRLSLRARCLFSSVALFLSVFTLNAQIAPAETSNPAAAAPAPTPSRYSCNYVHVDGTYIAMTFDDGPEAKLTPKLLDLLAAHDIKATFFVIGENVVEHPEIVARAAREGHEIGNHSWSHPNLGKMSDEAVRHQLRQTDDAIQRAIGKRPTLMRPPYGSLSQRQKQWIHDEFGYRVILWDVDPLDWKRPGPTVICRRILSETRPGSIVLSHDIHPGTIEAMRSTLDQLEAKGFKFVTVSELIAMAKPETRVPSTVRQASPSPGVRPQPKTAAGPPTPAG